MEFLTQSFPGLIKDIHYLLLQVAWFTYDFFAAVLFISRVVKYQGPQRPRVMLWWGNAELHKLNITLLNSGYMTRKWQSFLNEITKIWGRVMGLLSLFQASFSFQRLRLWTGENIGTFAYHRSVDVPERSLLAIEDLSFNLVSLLVHSVNIVTGNNKSG